MYLTTNSELVFSSTVSGHNVQANGPNQPLGVLPSLFAEPGGRLPSAYAHYQHVADFGPGRTARVAEDSNPGLASEPSQLPVFTYEKGMVQRYTEVDSVPGKGCVLWEKRCSMIV